MKKKVAVIGAGPAGMCAALAARAEGWDVTLYDHNEKTGKKLFITGKGRCNLTNDKPVEEYFSQIASNPKFLYASLYSYSSEQLKEMIEKAGTPLKTERGERVFPVSDKSSDILKAFNRLLEEAGVNVILNTHIAGIAVEETNEGRVVTGVRLKGGKVIPYDAVILATGGVSYRQTGSDGSGLQMAQKLGHTITPLRAALIHLKTKESWPGSLSGISLKNVTLTLKERGKKKDKILFSEVGEMLFTHNGISGPLALTASSLMKKDLDSYILEIDLKPGLTEERMEKKLLAALDAGQNKTLANALEGLMIKRLIPVLITAAGLNPEMRAGSVTKEERVRLATLFKHLPLSVKERGDINSAIVTAGGINVKEIDPSTMRSKKIQGLSFAGEMIDVDAFTGGYNIQIACSTGWLAGSSLSE